VKINNYRWLIAVLLFFATTINYIDRQIIGLLKPILEKEFNWSETDFAHIVMAFTAAYAIGLLLIGRLIDYVGTKTGYSITVIVWSIGAMLHALARSVTGFISVRIILGIGESGNFPAAMKAVSEWFPKKERALAIGIINAGTSIGVVLALAIVPWILVRYRWQEVFWITGTLGFVWLVFWVLLYELPIRQKRLSKSELDLITEGDITDSITYRKPLSWRELFAMKSTWAIVTGKLLIDPIFWFFLFWLPSYFSSAFSLDLKKPSLALMIIYVSTTIGSISGGFLSSWLINKGWPVLKARKTVLFVFAILQTSIISVQFISSMWVAVAVLSLAVAVHQAWATNVFTLAADMFPKESVSSVVGIAGMAGAVGGIFFPILVGFLLDSYRVQGNLTGGYNMLFIICGFTYMLAWCIIHVLTRKPFAATVH
jgi:ACS family hexuronate transporter-like MFS transporter